MFAPIPSTLTYRHSEVIVDIEKVERIKKARFIGDFGLRTKAGVDVLITCALFWVEEPEHEDYSNYFAVYRVPNFGGSLAVTNGQYCVSDPIVGLCMPSGEVIFSRHRHDMRTATTAPVSIDGGRDYIRTTCSPGYDITTVRTVVITVKDGIIHVEPAPADGTRGDKLEDRSNR